MDTSEIWFNEGTSITAELIYLAIKNGLVNEIDDFRYSLHAIYASSDAPTKRAYERLKEGHNVFIDALNDPPENFYGSIRWLNAHDTGRLFFVGLEEYGIYGAEIRELLIALDEIAEGGKTIGVDEIKLAANGVTGGDITPLLDLLEPGIVFNSYIRYPEHLDRAHDFLEQHPQYATPNVSWID